MKKRIFIILCLVIIFVGMLSFVYLNFIEGSLKPIVDITSLQTTQASYKKGDTIQIISTYCKSKDVHTTVQWSLVDHIVTTFPEKQLETFKGCFTDKVSNIEQVPPLVAPGDYYLQGNISYQINPFKSVEYTFTTNHFTIQ